MKSYINLIIVTVLLLGFAACDFDVSNPNAAREDEVLTNKDGLLALAIGIRQNYSTSALQEVIFTPGVTTREVGITSTFQSLLDLEDGGEALPNNNGNVSRLWSRLNRVKGMAENLIENASNVDLEPGTKSGLTAWGHLFKAITLGYLAQNFTDVPLDNVLNGNAAFSTRQEAFQESIRLLEEAIALISNTPVSQEFNSTVLAGQINLENCLNAFLSRYHLLAGNYSASIEAANNVDLTSTSVFLFDQENVNPIYNLVFVAAQQYAPRDDFGIPLPVDPDDGRRDFYLSALPDSNLNRLPIETLKGFFDDNEPIPLYLPGEMLLNKAEAYVRLDELALAVQEIDKVRTKDDDPFGINADLPPYSGPVTEQDLLDEIYTNRSVELFMTGMRLEDSRRFNRPEPPAGTDYTTERNRNFYPFPLQERLNNPNTPADPGI